MNRPLPPFQPPTRPTQNQPSFPAYLKQFEEWTDKYSKYMLDYFQQAVSVINTGAQGFSRSNLPADTSIYVTAYTSIVLGTAVITNISTSPNFSGQIHLISNDGFSTSTAGNINASVTVPAGGSVLADFNPVTNKWYISVGIGPGGVSVLFRAGIATPSIGSTDVPILFSTPLPTPYAISLALESNVGTSVRAVPATLTNLGFTARLGMTPTGSDIITVHYAAFPR